jgi:hypothetical protein
VWIQATLNIFFEEINDIPSQAEKFCTYDCSNALEHKFYCKRSFGSVLSAGRAACCEGDIVSNASHNFFQLCALLATCDSMG